MIVLINHLFRIKLKKDNEEITKKNSSIFFNEAQKYEFEKYNPINKLREEIYDIFFKVDVPIFLSFFIFSMVYMLLTVLKSGDHSQFAYGGLSLHIFTGTAFFLIEHSKKFFSIDIKMRIEFFFGILQKE
jgi:hypothetical protein